MDKFNELRRRFTQFMRGRYGDDELNQFLLIPFITSILLYYLFDHPLVTVLPFFFMGLIFFRKFSRNYHARAKENISYLELKNKIINKTQSNHKIYKCPNCQQKVRVPKGRGKIEITCPKCSHKFTKRS